MKGLLLKDFYLVRKYFKLYLLGCAAFLAAGIITGNYLWSVYTMLLIGMMPMSLLSNDEGSKWHLYSAVMPYSRRQMVSVKYLDEIIIVALFICVTALAQAVSGQGLWSAEMLQMLCVMTSVGLIGNGVIMPFLFWLGVEKGRRVYLMVFVCIFGTMGALSYLEKSMEIPKVKAGSALFLFGAAVVYAVSWAISTILYQRRELH